MCCREGTCDPWRRFLAVRIIDGMHRPLRSLSRHPRDPWFRRRPRWAIAVAAALFAGVFALRLWVGDPIGAAADLYAFPVALVAFAFGRSAGVGAGVWGAALMAVPLGQAGVDHSLLGWSARVLAIVLIGLVVGDASDRLAAAQRLRLDVVLATERHREAIEINDGLVQGMAATKWLLEAGRDGAALDVLNEALSTGEQMVSKLIREAGAGNASWR
jgi:signal transduction histidine kinase